jgi:hypothetical protein
LIRAETLVAARLLPEARSVLATALALCERAGAEDYLIKGRLERRATRACSPATMNPPGPWQRRAQRSFAAAGQRIYAARATGLMLAAAIADGDVHPSAIRSGGERRRRSLRRVGSRGASCRVARRARSRRASGRSVFAEEELEACAGLRRTGTVADRIDYWHTHGLVRLAEGDRRAGERALRTGLRLLDDYRGALGAK